MHTTSKWEIVEAFKRTDVLLFSCRRVTSLTLLDVSLSGLKRKVEAKALFKALDITPAQVQSLWTKRPRRWWDFFFPQKQNHSIRYYEEIGIFKIEPLPFIAIARILNKPIAGWEELDDAKYVRRLIIDPVRGVI